MLGAKRARAPHFQAQSCVIWDCNISSLIVPKLVSFILAPLLEKKIHPGDGKLSDVGMENFPPQGWKTL